MLDSAYSITITSIALFNGPLATSIIEFAILLKYKKKKEKKIIYIFDKQFINFIYYYLVSGY